MSGFPLCSWRIVLLEIEFIVDISFFQHLKNVVPFLLVSVVSDEKLAVVCIGVILWQYIVSLLLLSRFKKKCFFQNINNNVSWYQFLWLYPIWDSLSFLNFSALPNLRIFQPLLSLNTLFGTLPPLSLVFQLHEH